jgi:hypothetical protein
VTFDVDIIDGQTDRARSATQVKWSKVFSMWYVEQCVKRHETMKETERKVA